MVRGFLTFSAGVLALLSVTGMPSHLYAQRGRGGFRSGAPPQVGRFSPGMERRFNEPRFGEFSPGMERRFSEPRFGRFSPGFDQRFTNPSFSGFRGFTSGMNKQFVP